jgi:glutamate carboxypeptidase
MVRDSFGWLSLGLCAAVSLVGTAGAQGAPSAVEAAMVKSVDAGAPAAVAQLEKIVDINSGTMNLPGVVQVKDLLVPQIEALGFTTHWNALASEDARAGDLVAEHPCPQGTGKCGKKLLLIGHMDTVFEPNSPFQKYAIVPDTDGKIATGPGVNDMKGGLVVMLSALEAMKAAGVLKDTEITIALSGDEEDAGRPRTVSRKDLIDAGKRSEIALEFEPGGRDGGVDGVDTIRLGRRSSITWMLDTTGKRAHSAGIFDANVGDGAIYEMARILEAFRTQLREPGLTYSVGLVLAGSAAERNADNTGGTATGKSNVVPQTALANGDLRTLSDEQTARVEKAMQAIVSNHLPMTDAKITFEEGNYPAMAVTPASEELLEKLQLVNQTLGYAPEQVGDVMQGGAGDISFVAPYVTGLVGVGAMGTGAHSEHETVYLDSLPKQAKRMALLMYRLSQEK